MTAGNGAYRLPRFVRDWWTAHRLRVLIRYGWCPVCNSSPPRLACEVCLGSPDYAYRLTDSDRATWAARYVALRTAAKPDEASS